MSTWTAPITWTNGAVTAGTMNTEVRDHLSFLKGALDLLTASTTADTGTATYIDVRRTNSTDQAFRSGVSGAANPEFQIDRNGKMGWGAGGGSGLDTFLARAAANVLELTGDSLFRVLRTGGSPVYFDGRQSGDASRRVTFTTHSSGGGEMQMGDGTTSSLARLYYDSGTSETVWSSLIASGDMRVHIDTAQSFVFATSTTAATNFFSIFNSAGAGTAILRWLNGTTVDATLNPSSGYMTSSLPVYSGEGLRVKTKAGALSDVDYGIAGGPQSGHSGLDTSNSRLYMRSGSTWRFAEMGARNVIGPWTFDNVTASQTNTEMGIGGIASAGSTARVSFDYDGLIVGMSVRGSANLSGGNITFKPTIAGSTTATANITVSSGSASGRTSVAPSAGAAFSAGNALGVAITTDASYAPTTVDWVAFLYVLFTT